jgi:hypothetical protein
VIPAQRELVFQPGPKRFDFPFEPFVPFDDMCISLPNPGFKFDLRSSF